MDVKVVQELKPYSYNQLVDWIGQEEYKAKNIIKNLVYMNILKKLTSFESKLELEDLIDVESFSKIEDIFDKNMYVFNYVGMVMVGECCFFVYPKYIKNINEDAENNFRKFKQILSVIRKYQSKEQIHSMNGSQEIIEFNLLAFTLDLLQDYYENGIYSNDKSIIEENGCGEILWEKTINESNVYFSNGIPVYLDLYTINDVLNEEDLFRRLHRCIISRCCEEIRDILEVLEITPVSISSERIEDFGNKEYLTCEIKQELIKQFITRKQNILIRMLSYINRNNVYNGSLEISFVGTNCFNLVWEDVCSCVKNNCLNKTFSQIGLKPYDNKKSSDTLMSIIPKPKWKHCSSGNVYEAKKTLIPDLVSIRENKIYIYDAKYYNIKLNKEGVRNQPGISDVTKQYLYELSFKKLAKKNNLKIEKNAFLMPSDDSEEKIIGSVLFNVFSEFYANNSVNEIEIILEPCELLYDKYLRV